MKIKEIFKNKRNIIIIIVVLLLIIAFIATYFILKRGTGYIGKAQNTQDEIDFKTEYEKLNDQLTEEGIAYPEVSIKNNNSIKYVKSDEIVDIINNRKDAVVYFGFPECMYCRSAIEVLVNESVNTELSELGNILYLNTKDETENYDKLISLLDEKFIEEENETKKVYSPLVLFIANGQVVSYNKGTLFSQESPYTKLDESQVKGLGEIYRYGIRDVVESIKSKQSIAK